MLLLLLAPQPPPPAPGFVNVSLTVSELWPPLNATGPSDAIFWTQSELFEWINEAAKRLSHKLGVFVIRDTLTTLTLLNIGDYALPNYHIHTLQCDLNGKVLRARNVQELEAADAAWPTTIGPPVAFLEDTLGFRRLTIYPAPDAANQTLPINFVMAQISPEVSAASPVIPAPACLREYFTFYTLAEARTKQSNAQMDEIGEWFRGIVDQYEQVMRGLWN